jgi:hypothetical protein
LLKAGVGHSDDTAGRREVNRSFCAPDFRSSVNNLSVFSNSQPEASPMLSTEAACGARAAAAP